MAPVAGSGDSSATLESTVSFFLDYHRIFKQPSFLKRGACWIHIGSLKSSVWSRMNINVFLRENDYFLHKRYFNITSVEGMEEIVRIKHLIKLEKRQCLSHFWLENKYRRESDMPLLK